MPSWCADGQVYLYLFNENKLNITTWKDLPISMFWVLQKLECLHKCTVGVFVGVLLVHRAVLERNAVLLVPWSTWQVVGLLLGFGFAKFLFCVLSPVVLRDSGATALHLSLLTADFYWLVLGIILLQYKVNHFCHHSISVHKVWSIVLYMYEIGVMVRLNILAVKLLDWFA